MTTEQRERARARAYAWWRERELREPERLTPVKRARIDQGRLQAEVAAAAMLSPARLSKIESGARPPARTRFLLARALGRPEDELFPTN